MWHEPSISLIHLDRWHARIHEATKWHNPKEGSTNKPKSGMCRWLEDNYKNYYKWHVKAQEATGDMIQRKAVEMGQKVAKQKA